jgi:GNAT superfamily N-acetyltransferase
MRGATNSSGLTFRQDYFGDDAAWAALVSLLKDTFGIDIDPLRQLGGADPTSMPFGWFDDTGTLAANLSAFAMPIVINGRTINAAGFQSGAVRPPWRGRGLYRDVTAKALEWCDQQRFEAVVLYTDKPDLYTPYGFVSLPMHLHAGDAPTPIPATTPSRRLDPWNAEDLALLQEDAQRPGAGFGPAGSVPEFGDVSDQHAVRPGYPAELAAGAAGRHRLEDGRCRLFRAVGRGGIRHPHRCLPFSAASAWRRGRWRCCLHPTSSAGRVSRGCWTRRRGS